jgi:hypothetical protein
MISVVGDRDSDVIFSVGEIVVSDISAILSPAS